VNGSSTLGCFSTSAQKPLSVCGVLPSATGHVSTMGWGAPGIAEQSGFFWVAGARHFGPQLRRNRLWLSASAVTCARSAGSPFWAA